MTFQEKIGKLPLEVKDYLLSNDSRLELEKSCFLYGINESLISSVSKEVGLIFTQDFPLKELPFLVSKNFRTPENISYGIAYEINKRIFSRFPEYFKESQIFLNQWSQLKSPPIVSDEEANKKILEVEPWIKNKAKDDLVKEGERQKEIAQVKENLTKLSLAEALRIYLKVGEQLITSSSVTLRNFPYPVRPSIKNWISDYTFNLGYEKHTALERSKYLFRSQNARNLSEAERQKLAELLKSFDEGALLVVNKKTQQIIFTQTQTVPEKKVSPPAPPHPPYAQQRPIPASSQTAPAQEKNINTLQFSHRQKFPYEQGRNSRFGNLPPSQPASGNPRKKFDFSQAAPIATRPELSPPKNVVNLKNFPI